MPLEKRCFVPVCNNTSDNSSKIFLVVPYDDLIRKKWFTAAKLYCCEDHFDVSIVYESMN